TVLLLAFTSFRGRQHVPLKSGAAAAYLAAFIVALSPMLSIYKTGGGNSSQHLIVLGLGEPFTEALGIDTGSLYEWSYDYRDEFAHAMIGGYADRRLGQHKYLEMYGAEYDRAGSQYLADLAETFPADMLLRVYASSLRILELPYGLTAVQPPRFVDNDL